MPAVNGVGEPCAGEPHARFEVAGAGNGAARSAFCESRVGVLKDATTTTRSGLSRSISGNRASARPYTKPTLITAPGARKSPSHLENLELRTTKRRRFQGVTATTW
jgi:hypothetical protein